jgi:hypothetical protein
VFALHNGQLAAAGENFAAGLAGLRPYGEINFANIARSGLADVLRLQGEYERSSLLYLETIKIWRTMGNLGAVARCLECLGFMAMAQAKALSPNERTPRLSRAARLFGAAEALRNENRSDMTPSEQAEYDGQKTELAELSSMPGPIKTFIEQAWLAGRNSGLDELMAEEKTE